MGLCGVLAFWGLGLGPCSSNEVRRDPEAATRPPVLSCASVVCAAEQTGRHPAAAVQLPERPLDGRSAAGLKLPLSLRAREAAGTIPLSSGKVELSGRLLPAALEDGHVVAVHDEEPTSVVAYFLATRWAGVLAGGGR
jgi:hypothetical protein